MLAGHLVKILTLEHTWTDHFSEKETNDHKYMKIYLTSFILIEIQTKSEVEYPFVLTDGYKPERHANLTKSVNI